MSRSQKNLEKFVIHSKKVGRFSAVVFTASYLNFFEHFTDEVELSLVLSIPAGGEVLIDLICCNGNSSWNRFITARFNGKKIERSSILNLPNFRGEERRYCDSFYQNNPKYLKYAVETDVVPGNAGC